MEERYFTGRDTRGTKRIKFEVPVVFSIDKSMGKEVRLKEQEKMLKGVTKNINAKGLAIETDIFLPFGTLLDINIGSKKESDNRALLKGATYPLIVLGKIASVRSVGGGMYRLGIAFVKIKETDKIALDAYVKENLPFGQRL